MFFKIVETIEKGRKQLTIVPSAWVKNSILSWPKMGAEKLIQNANSTPDTNWFTMECKLKRNHLISYEIAEDELERMLENDDTEQEGEIEFMPPKKRPRVILPKTKPSQNDFNSFADECVQQMQVPLSVATPGMGTNEVNTVPENVCYQILPNVGNISSVFETQTITSPLDSQLNEKVNTIISNQETIIQKQQIIIDNFEHSLCKENQVKIMQQLAKLETMLDSLAANSVNGSCSCNPAYQNALGIKEDILFEPLIDSLPELERLESKLSNKTVIEEYVMKFSYVCGRKGFGNGISNCYILVDKIFTRKFMTLCSWAGGARDGKEKIPFKMFKNIINLFFRVVRLSDEEFTLKKCEEFFKAIIRNSTKRHESSLSRSSRPKNRPRSLSYKIKKGENGIQENNNSYTVDDENKENHYEQTTGSETNIAEDAELESDISEEEAETE